MLHVRFTKLVRSDLMLHDVGTEKACVFAEHGFYILNPAVVARKLIAPLGSVYAFSCNLVLSLIDQFVANLFQHRHDNLVEKVMALYI